MRLKSKIFINLFILFFSLEILEIKLTILLIRALKITVLHSLIIEAMKIKLKILIKDKKLFKEQNSCINNSLCRG